MLVTEKVIETRPRSNSKLHRVLTKACKKCGGDLAMENDNYGTYLECIQCGATWNEHDPIRRNRPSDARDAKRQLALAGSR
jgi:hypothetical protein